MAYKKNQGRMVRMTAFWVLAILIFYGCSSLRAELISMSPDTLGAAIQGKRLPILSLDLSPALIISALVLAVGLWLLYRWEQKPKNADLLIETEAELRKVHWPSLDEALSGSWAVLMTVVFLMAFLAGADYVLGEMAKVVLTGGR